MAVLANKHHSLGFEWFYDPWWGFVAFYAGCLISMNLIFSRPKYCFCIGAFKILKTPNRLKGYFRLIAKEPPPEKPKLTIDQQLLTEIRDALKK